MTTTNSNTIDLEAALVSLARESNAAFKGSHTRFTDDISIAKSRTATKSDRVAHMMALSDMGYSCGSLRKQVRFNDIIEKYRLGLAAVELGHLVGTVSYEPFSWYNSPETSDSTPENNLNALYRHMCAFEKCTVIDDKSFLPHPVHMACRSAMLVSVIYKEQNGCDNIADKSVDTESRIYGHNIGQVLSGLEFGYLLTSAEYYALSRVDADAITDAPVSFYLRMIHGELATLGSLLRELSTANDINTIRIEMSIATIASLIFRNCLLLVAAWFREEDNVEAFKQAISWYEHYEDGKYDYISTYSDMYVLPLLK